MFSKIDKLSVAGILALTLLTGVTYTVRSYNKAIAENGTLKAEAVQWSKAVKDYQKVVDIQNGAIAIWKAKGDKLTVEVSKAAKEVTKIKYVYEHKVQTILVSEVPRDCRASIQWSVQKSKELSQW